MPFASSQEPLSIEWLKKAAEGRLELTGVNVWKALRHASYIQVIDVDENVMHNVARLDRCASFRVTRRGYELLEGAKEKESADLPFDKNDPPLDIRLWISAFRRWTRNCPKGLHLAYSEGQLHVIAADKTGKVIDDSGHRIASMKVPWHRS